MIVKVEERFCQLSPNAAALLISLVREHKATNSRQATAIHQLRALAVMLNGEIGNEALCRCDELLGLGAFK